MQKKKNTPILGADYWHKNYSRPHEMDGIVNAKAHAQYLKAFFDLDFVDISSIIDLGFGMGYLFKEIALEFIPNRMVGIEPSSYIFESTTKNFLRPVESTNISLYNTDGLSWLKDQRFKAQKFDLGICTSVLQYVDKRDLPLIFKKLCKRVKYLYLSVPTSKELKRQEMEYNFKDEFAIRRSKSFYLNLLRPYFCLISARIFESKYFFTQDNSSFSELLFRF